ncbi:MULTISPECIES: hypothetical protein [Streptomyces]|uniref:Uncharacterized protein n=1 Tax=Streptomyces sp. 900129855 TaxID=3155129 RepID=A0ABV2ZJX0_9ACTN
MLRGVLVVADFAAVLLAAVLFAAVLRVPAVFRMMSEVVLRGFHEGHREGRQEEFTQLAAKVQAPVHLTLAEYEQVWANGPEGLADLASMFTGAPRVVGHEQAGAGHNTSVGRTAAAYHLNVLAFVEECALGVQALPTEKGTWG